MEFTELVTSKQSPPRVFTTKPRIWLELSCGTTATSRTLPAVAPLSSKTGAPNRSERASGGIELNICDAIGKCAANLMPGHDLNAAADLPLFCSLCETESC